MLNFELNNLQLFDARGSGKSTILDCGSLDPAQAESYAIDLESKFGISRKCGA
ncbi:hypothetical protein Plhal304r1_c017g0062841 [Plasmopara halstedii]